ncbi:hypothetical protein [Myroides profundi]|uniref:Uncharacterized protein n=1 Tax=Myroides profundi TaxID=480520 RepID=A0AAJ4W7M6_MYRPR|nr:hypothetical protein [Myroides profundi]AJH13869.1 hypothetical protein MPR_0669 [Myroides profundi]SER61559.1 hypothetical protein SAMN04488089_12129 [Myroides profundi]
MRTEICSCEGLDPFCDKCFGTGHAPLSTSKKTVTKQSSKVKPIKKIKSYLPEKIDSLTKIEIDALAIKIISTLDLKSKKQMQILNSIPFSTSTFRRDYKEKFIDLENIETEKQQLRNDLFILDQEIVSKNYRSHFTFRHFLSDKDVDVTSNRELKGLIREYKKLKK